MLVWLSRRVVRDAWLVVTAWAALAVVVSAVALSGLAGVPLHERLHAPGTSVPGTHSAEGQQVLDSLTGDAVIVTLLVSGVDMDSTRQQEQVSAALEDAHAELRDLVGSSNVLDPFVIPGGLDSEAARSMTATGRDGFIMTVTVNPNGADVADPDDEQYAEEVSSLVDTVTHRLEQVPGELAEAVPAAEGTVSHEALVEEELRAQAVGDLERAVLVGAPVVLLLVVLLLGGLVPAAAPALGTLVSVAGALGTLYATSLATELPFLAASTGILSGLGLSAAYGTLLTSRYREELVRQGSPGGAGAAEEERAHRHRTGRLEPLTTGCLTRTMLTTGRTIVFASLAVAVSLCGLYLLGNATLRPVGLAGAVIVVVAMAASLTAVPAVLVLLGRRLTGPFLLERIPFLGRVLGRPTPPAGDADPGTDRETDPAAGRLPTPLRLLHTWPWAVLGACLLLLVVLALPLGGLHVLCPREERLPASSQQQAYWEDLEQGYPAAAEQDATLVLAGTGQRVTSFVNDKVAAAPGVTDVVSLATAGDYTVVYLDLEGEEWSSTAEDAVRAVQDLEPPTELWVTGQAADQVDFRDSLLSHLPVALGVAAAVTGVLLFLLTGSLLLPFTTLALSCLSTTASLGVLTWILQDGHGAGLLGMTPVGGLEAAALAVSVSLGLGLATGQGVLLLGRVMQYHDAGLDDDAVGRGLQRSGRTVLGPALVTAAAYTGLVAGDLPASKETGLALVLVTVADAVLARVLLAPAVLRILGRWSWWAPALLVRSNQPRERQESPGLRPARSRT